MNSSNIFKTDKFLTDGGLETTMIFQEGIDLNHFAAFELLTNDGGRKALKRYFRSYLQIAEQYQMNFVLEAPTWRANTDWGYKLGYSKSQLSTINKKAISFMREMVTENNWPEEKVLISGSIGPRGDGYVADNYMKVQEAKAYHTDQIQAFALADVDFVTAMSINYSNEATGVVEAAKTFNVPVVISFTVETDGNLPSGESLNEAIAKVDQSTDSYVEHFMINCAHPEHFKHRLNSDDSWIKRIGGIRANASTLSHAELDESDTLDAGDKVALAGHYDDLFKLLPNLQVVGGCCGTDHTHMEAVCEKIF